MKVSQEILQDYTIQYPIEKLCEPEKILFLDIETTGFTARSSYLYLIGCAFFREGSWRTIQWMAENYQEETQLLDAFFRFAENYTMLAHYNGNNFDLPYLMEKCRQLELPYSLDSFEGIDLYRRIASCKTFLCLENCKQKTVEKFLGINREDICSGGDLIGVYQDYVNAPSEEGARLLLLHNRDDLRGMLSILPMLAYQDALHLPLKAKKVQANRYRDSAGGVRTELLISIGLPTPVPKAVMASSCGCFAKLEGALGEIRVPVREGELKYFYANYKDYYYLPEEDLALHKSVATFVEKEKRIQATAQNCYTRKKSQYLRQWSPLFAPFFKKDYSDRELYFELTDEMKKNRSAFASYASHILNMLAENA